MTSMNTFGSKRNAKSVKVTGTGMVPVNFNLSSGTLATQVLLTATYFYRTAAIAEAYGLYRFNRLKFQLPTATSSYAFSVTTDDASGAIANYLDAAEMPCVSWVASTQTICTKLLVNKKFLQETQVKWFETKDTTTGLVPIYINAASISGINGFIYVFCEYEMEFAQPVAPAYSLHRLPPRPTSGEALESHFVVEDEKVLLDYVDTADNDKESVQSVKSVVPRGQMDQALSMAVRNANLARPTLSKQASVQARKIQN